GEGPLRARCEQQVRAAGLERSVRFLGFVPDMPSFHAACDVVVQPSEAEGCPDVVLEAMAVERAVVVAATRAAIEVVSQGHTGLVYPVGDVGAAAEAVGRLLASPAWRKSLAQAARAHVRRHLDARVTVGRMAKLIVDLVEQRGRADAPRSTRLAGARA